VTAGQREALENDFINRTLDPIFEGGKNA